MKKLKFVLVLSLLVAGLSVSPALADEHVNLWPIYMYESGTHDIIWPLGKYKSTNEWRFFPVIKDRSLFCIFPEFWFGSSEFAVLPIYAKYDFSKGVLFPVLWWDFQHTDRITHSIFPLYGYSSCGYDGDTTFWTMCGLGGYRCVGGTEPTHWLFPLYWTDSVDFISIPYMRGCKDGKINDFLFLGLFGRTLASEGNMTAHWMLPLYGKTESGLVAFLLGTAGYNHHDDYTASWCMPLYFADNKGLFLSPLWCHHIDPQGEIDRWVLPWLLSGGFSKDGVKKNVYLFNAAGTMSTERGYSASWCMPFYFKDNEGLFVTPLCGRNKTAHWFIPLWYGDEQSFSSLLWCNRTSDDGLSDYWTIPPLLSGGSTKADGSHEAGFLLGLGGATWGGAQNKRSSWAFPLYYEDNNGRFITPLFGKNKTDNWTFPLYYYDGVNGDLATILYGRDTRGDFVTRWWATPLVGTYSGSKTGGWLFPLFNRKKDNSYDADLKRLDSPTIPEDITFSYQVHSWTNDLTQEVSIYTNVVESVQVWSHIRGSFLLGSDHDRRVRGRVLKPFCGQDRGADHTYELSATSKHGNLLFFNRATERSVGYDIHTRQKTYERLSSQTTALCGLLYDNSYRILSDGHSSVHTSILGKLWERKEEYGRVTVDAFPAFSYEKKSDGSTMTSFLWRFYRYGVDMEKGITLDLFFIPICRPR